jgi:hypothetical protein
MHGRELLRPIWEHRRLILPLAAVLFITYAFFVCAPAWNQNSRLALTRALVERRSVAIDPDHETTGDKSFRADHFYSDKAPGVSVAATVPYAALFVVWSLTGGELPAAAIIPLDPIERAAEQSIPLSERKPGDRLVYNAAHRVALYTCSVTVVAATSVLAMLGVFLLAIRQTADPRRASAIAATYAMATPAFVYSTAFYGHQVCASALCISFALTVLPQAGCTSKKTAWAVGTGLGWAMITEYPSVVAAAMILALARNLHGWRFAGHTAFGILPWAGLLALYHTVAFGSPWSTGYDFVYLPEFAEGMKDNYGLGAPRFDALLQITFGSYRGLFVLAPVLLLAVWGLGVMTAQPGPLPRGGAIVAAAIAGYFVVLNSGYYMWDGGAAAGPRHLVPMLPFLVLGLAPAWERLPWACRVLAGVSALQMTMLAVAGPEAPQSGSPLWEFALQRLRDATPGDGKTTNLAALLGLPPLLSLVPLAAIWAWLASVAIKTDQ